MQGVLAIKTDQRKAPQKARRSRKLLGSTSVSWEGSKAANRVRCETHRIPVTGRGRKGLRKQPT